ncbi:alkaline phosphatase family protein [Rubritalea spongiae]|uniref:Alkaline phosphatase family protein n=1 Tax=Rubritalea spongiae TaxID=430797 RepID=A0ABW5E6W4_9BACT
MKNATTPGRKVLLIGWDAADWKVIKPLIAQGKMPHLKKLVEAGVSANLATLQPVLSPMLWSSVATGKRPYKHGVYGFSEPDPVTNSIRPVTNLSRKTKAIWNILNQEEKSTITVGWWPSNPAEPLSRGVMVSNDYQTAHGNDRKKWPLKPGTIHPERLKERLADLRFHLSELNEDDLFPFLPGLEGMTQEELDKVSKDRRVHSLMKIIADCTSIHSAATALMQNESWDLCSVYYDAIDHFGHAFMKYHPPQRPQVDDWDYRVYNYCVEAGYRYHDMMLGSLLDLAGEDTTVVLMSDHGFHPDDLRLSAIPREPAGPAAEHRQFGIFVARGPGLKKGGNVYGANLLDICPTLLQLFGLPAGEDMDGKVLLDIFEEPAQEIERLPSWDAVDGDHGMHPSDKQISAADSKAALEQLVALGYIEEPDEDQSVALEKTVRELDYNLAQAYIDGGLYTEAVAILERLYKKWPMEHRFGFKLTACYQNLNQTDKLRGLVTTVIERRLKEARDALEELKGLRLDEDETQKLEAEQLEQMSEKEKNVWKRERVELIAKSRPNLFSLRYLEAQVDFSEGNYEGALYKLAQLDSDFGARRRALCLRGEVYQRQRRWDESRLAFEEALAVDEESPAPLLGMARTELARKNHTRAVAHARASLELLFFQPKAHYIHGLANYRLGNWLAAEKAFLQCVRQAPLFSAAYRMLGEIARWYRHDPEAAVFFKNKVRESRKELKRIREEKQRVLEQEIQPVHSHEEMLCPLAPHPASLDGISSEEIITVVSGLPRSGTSLMMQVLEAIGFDIFTDSNRSADESNEKGYFEHDKVTSLMSDNNKAWVADSRGRCIKVVAPLLSSLPLKMVFAKNEGTDKIIRPLHYRVLFIERDLQEIVDSQSTMLERMGKVAAGGEFSKAYLQQVHHAKQWCAKHCIHAMSVPHYDLVHAPDEILPQILSFLGLEADIDDIRAVIDPSLHRSRNQI